MTRSIVPLLLLGLAACVPPEAEDASNEAALSSGYGWVIVEHTDSDPSAMQVRAINGGLMQCSTTISAPTCPIGDLDLGPLGFSTAEDAALRVQLAGNGVLANVFEQALGDGRMRVALREVWRATSPARTTTPLYLAHALCPHTEKPGPVTLSACTRGWSATDESKGPASGGTVGLVDLSHVTASLADLESGLGGTESGVFVSGTTQSTATQRLVADQLWLPMPHVPLPLDAKPISVSVPTTQHAGQIGYGVIRMQNVGSTTWTRATAFSLGSQNPQDNGTWGTGRFPLAAGDAIAPGQTKQFIMQITAPSAPGLYHFQWKMVQDGVAWFGTITDDIVVTIPTEACANHPIDPTGVQPATAAIQACLDAAPPGGTVALPVGTYAIDTMLQINHAVTLTTAGLTASSPGCDTTACAILQATSSFNAPPQGGWPAGIRSVLMVQSNDVTVDHIRIDGNRAARIQSWAAAQCRNGVTNAYGFSSMVFGARVSFRHVMVENTLCGTSIGWAGDDATLADSFVRDSGSHNDHNMWADGVTILQSDRMHVTNNHVMNGSDVSLILFGGRDGVTGNLIEQPGQGAFAGLMLFHEQSGTGGDFSNTLLQNNTLECHHNCSFGIHTGGRPWETGEATRVIGGLITGNTVHDSAYGVTVTNAGSTAAPVQVWGNTVTGPFRGSFGQLCPVGTTSGGVPFDLGPGNDIFGQPTDSFLDTHGEPPSHWSHYSMCRRD